MKIYSTTKPPARVTRARAAATNASKNMLPPRPSTTKTSIGNLKRPALDENGIAFSDETETQHKRRAVLKEVTNICFENSYKSCASTRKIQSKKTKQARRVSLNDSKVALVLAAKTPRVNEADASLEFRKREITESQIVTLSVNLEENVLIKQSPESKANWNICPQLEDTSPLSECSRVSKEDKGKLCEKRSESYPGIVDIDFDHKDPQACAMYAPDIYSNLCVVELTRRPSSNYMEAVQRDITESMRGILVDWLVEVSEEYRLTPDTLHLCVFLIDRFLSQNYIERQRLQLLGITCMLVASKYEEICAPHVEDFCFITDSTYTRDEVLKMESQVLNCLGFHLSFPTARTFLRRYVQAAHASLPKIPRLELKFLACYLSELTLLDYGFLKFLPSLVAASAVLLAIWTLDQSDHPWNPTLEYYTCYKTSDLKAVVFALYDLHINTSGCSLNAVRDKYKQDKFKCVASLSFPELPETLF